MYYLKSEQVKAFPLAKPRLGLSKDITSRIFYEQNVSNIIRQIIDVQGFVISGKVNEDGSVSEKLCFDIFGYYFELGVGTELVNEEIDDKVFVMIRLTDAEPFEIDGQDEDGSYKGLMLSNRLEDGCKGFQLLESSKDSSGTKRWKLFDSSYSKFEVKSLGIDWIDAKHK